MFLLRDVCTQQIIACNTAWRASACNYYSLHPFTPHPAMNFAGCGVRGCIEIAYGFREFTDFEVQGVPWSNAIGHWKLEHVQRLIRSIITRTISLWQIHRCVPASAWIPPDDSRDILHQCTIYASRVMLPQCTPVLLPMLHLTQLSKYLPTSGKLQMARSRRYRRKISQPNTRWSDLSHLQPFASLRNKESSKCHYKCWWILGKLAKTLPLLLKLLLRLHQLVSIAWIIQKML